MTVLTDGQQRAELSGGRSADAITGMVGRAVAERCGTDLVIIDVGCGRGDLFDVVGPRARRYLGVDAIWYPALPPQIEFVAADLNGDEIGVPDAVADVVAAVETIEHLENPRRFVRLLVRLLRPGSWLVVTTPNQRSLLSLASLVVKGEFAHFQGVHYPAALASAFPRALSDNLMLVARRR